MWYFSHLSMKGSIIPLPSRHTTIRVYIYFCKYLLDLPNNTKLPMFMLSLPITRNPQTYQADNSKYINLSISGLVSPKPASASNQLYKPKQNKMDCNTLRTLVKTFQRALGSSNNLWEQFCTRTTLISKDTTYSTFSLSFSTNPNLRTTCLLLSLEGLLELTTDHHNIPWLITRL